MKKIIILAIATLSTGIVLSGSLKKNDEAAVKATQLKIQKDLALQTRANNTSSADAVATGD